MSQGKKVRSYQLKSDLSGDTLWLCSGSIFMAINKHHQEDEDWKDCIVDHFIIDMDKENKNWKMERIRRDEHCDREFIRMSSCSCDKTYAFSFRSWKDKQSILGVG